MVPYDAGLYELAKSRWEFGDWTALKSISFEAVADHPDRAKLALFVGAGYAQSFDYKKAGMFFKAAKDWGCPKGLLVQVLASGLHNTYGRASVMAGDEKRALSHLQQALSLVKPSGDLTLIQKARVQEQLSQLGIVDDARTFVSNGLDLISPTEMFSIKSKQGWNEIELSNLLKKTESTVERLKNGLDKAIKREVENSTKQLMAFMSLERYFETGELAEMNTERHSWPISPDFGLLLVRFLERTTYDLVVEFGSGFSTRLIAKTLKKTAEKSGVKQHAKFISFDHLEKYHDTTKQILSHSSLSDFVDLALAPLAMASVPDRGDFPFYACGSRLEDVRAESADAIEKIFVVVDGPPGDIGSNARYPALNALMSVFPKAEIHLLLDDFVRQEEKVVVEMWIEDLNKASVAFVKEEIKLDKDACFLKINTKFKVDKGSDQS